MMVEWRFALMEPGVQFVMTPGMKMMRLLFVDNWNTQEVSQYQPSNNYMAEAGWSPFSVNVGFKTDLSWIRVLPNWIKEDLCMQSQ